MPTESSALARLRRRDHLLIALAEGIDRQRSEAAGACLSRAGQKGGQPSAGEENENQVVHDEVVP